MLFLALFTGSCDRGVPAQVRQALRGLQEAAELTDRLVEDLALVATELITNAVAAGSAMLDVALMADPPTVELSVTDDAPGLPRIGTPELLATGGRGLAIVAALAAQWGIVPEQEGKTVWARFDV